MSRKAYGLRAVILVLCFLSTSHIVCGVEEEKDVFSFKYKFELHEDGTCHVIVTETITLNEHYIDNPKLKAELDAEKADAKSDGGMYSMDGPGSGGQTFQRGTRSFLIEYLLYLERIQYNPHNFKATDYRTGNRLDIKERESGEYKEFIIEIADYMGEPKKGDVYILTIEYDAENRVESIGNGRYAFSFYREGKGKDGPCEYEVSIKLPPYYEYEKSKITNPSSLPLSGAFTTVHYQGAYTKDGVFEFRLEYHYPVAVFVKEGNSLLEKGNYSAALEKFEEAKKRYQILGEASEVANVNSLISYCMACELFESSERSFISREFTSAQQQFEALLSQYGGVIGEEMKQECSHYIEICSKYVQAEELETQAENDMQAKNLKSALSSLQEAKNIYLELGDNDEVSRIEKRIAGVQEILKKEGQKFQLKLFALGSVAVIGGLFFAFLGHDSLKKTAKTEVIDVGSLLESPDIPEEVKEFLEEKIGWRRVPEKASRKNESEFVEKLKEGEETLKKMFIDGLISEREYDISIEEIRERIKRVESGKLN